MLNQLFGSNARVKILNAFLNNPEEKYYIRQLGRDLGLQVNSVRRELQNLESIGLLLVKSASDDAHSEVVRAMQEKKYYQVNKNFVLFDELHGLFSKTQLLAGQSFISDLRAHGEPKLIMLSGSFVDDPLAKTDLLIVAKVDKEDLLKAVAKLEENLGQEVRYTVLSEEEFRYRQAISDAFVFNLFKSKHLLLLNEISNNE